MGVHRRRKAIFLVINFVFVLLFLLRKNISPPPYTVQPSFEPNLETIEPLLHESSPLLSGFNHTISGHSTENIFQDKNILVTGAAGFIGMHLSLELKKQGYNVVGYDNLSALYSLQLKELRIDILLHAGIPMVRADVCDQGRLRRTIKIYRIDRIIQLATNNDCFTSLLETMHEVGMETKGPLLYLLSSGTSTDDATSLYRLGDGTIAETYYNLYKLKSIGLRLSTVYGPYGRPDMDPYIFTDKISQGQVITMSNNGDSGYDITYIDDIVMGIAYCLYLNISKPKLLDLDNNDTTTYKEFVHIIEENVGRSAGIKMVEMQKGDVPINADISKASQVLGFAPQTTLQEGMKKFTQWFRKNNGAQFAMQQNSVNERGNAVNHYDICFVTSIFGSTHRKADSPHDVSFLHTHFPNFRFFIFTNMENLRSQGWTKVLKQLTYYRRIITRSRWAKFLGWKDPELQPCKSIVYIDPQYRPKNSASYWKSFSEEVRKSQFGLAQRKHWNIGVIQEFKDILAIQKDLPKNVEASLKWFKEQPDYNDTQIQLYQNNVFCYDPLNSYFRELSELFWSHYALEEDSWRDQPLWAYLLTKLHITPVDWNITEYLVHDSHNVGSHTYAQKDDG